MPRYSHSFMMMMMMMMMTMMNRHFANYFMMTIIIIVTVRAFSLIVKCIRQWQCRKPAKDEPLSMPTGSAPTSRPETRRLSIVSSSFGKSRSRKDHREVQTSIMRQNRVVNEGLGSGKGLKTETNKPRMLTKTQGLRTTTRTRTKLSRTRIEWN